MADVKIFPMATQLPLITKEGMLNIPGARSMIKEAEEEIKRIISLLAENIGLEIVKIKLGIGKSGSYEITISVEI